jgi:Second Messenger Oligonucleotide or Dinucleotide Synthetase domain
LAISVAQAFVEFADKLRPTPAQETIIAHRRRAVEGFLIATYGPTSLMPLQHTRVIGSAARGTLIRPIDDVDLFCVFDDSQVWSQYQANSQHLLYRVREALTNYRVETVGSRGQAVRLFYTDGPHVDITPAFPVMSIFGVQTGFYIPRGDGGWQQTDPYEQHDFMARRNQDLSGYLKRLVRMLKRWNRVHSSRLKSFHLEVMTQAIFSSLGSNSREAVEMFFNHAASYLHVNDPAGYGGDLGSSLAFAQKQAITQSFATAAGQAKRARAAEAQGAVVEALRQWRVVFGNDFPSYG